MALRGAVVQPYRVTSTSMMPTLRPDTDVLVVTKADLGEIALRARRDLSAALRSLGARDTAVVAVSSLDEALDALAAHGGSGLPPSAD